MVSIQKQVDKVISQFDPTYFPLLPMITQISKEAGELARELNNLHKRLNKKRR